MPRVSVIIAAFNCEAYVAEALRSVHEQSYDDWEIVLADDGSTDRTAEIARGFERVVVLESESNAGLPAARNRAISRAGGELLALLDADDYWLPEYLKWQVDIFDREQSQNGNIGIVACNAHLLGPDGAIGERTYMDVIRFPDCLTLTDLLRGNPIYVSALVPRSVIEDAGYFHSKLRRMPDWDLWLRIVERGYRVAATRRPLAVYRVRRHSLSSDAYRMAKEAQLVYRRALDRGNLSRRQRRIARRELRLQRAVEAFAAEGSPSPFFRVLPLFALVAVEHPSRWFRFGRLLAGRRRLGELIPSGKTAH